MAAAYFFRALELGKEDLALALLHKGVKINSTTTDGVSALQFAISVGAERVVSFLIGRVADWNAKDDIGWTALHYAAYANNMDVVLMLVGKRSLDVLAKNMDGCTALDVARAKGYGKVASVLEWAMRNSYKGDKRRLQGGANQKGARDLYTTPPRTIDPLLPVLLQRFPKGSVLWEPCVGTGAISSVLETAGYEVEKSDLFLEDGSIDPDFSFIDCTMNGETYFACDVPDGIHCIVTNPPFSEKLAFIRRVYEIGLPAFLLLPLDTLGTKGCSTEFDTHGVEIFFLRGRAASTFFKVSEQREVDVGPCAWFALNMTSPGKNNTTFL